MKNTGLTISTTGHALLLGWAMLSFSAKPFEAAPVDSLPVDIVSATEFSQMMAGSKAAPKVVAPKPKPVVDKVAEPTPPKDPTPKVSEKQEIQTASAEPTPPPIPQPRPPEARPEPKVDEIAEALKKEQAKKPPPPQPPKKPPPPKLELSRIENKLALLDKREQQRHAATGAVLNQTPTLGLSTGNAPQLSQSEIDALRAQIQACWNPPAGVADARELVVKVRLMLNQDGSLAADPSVVNRGGNSLFQVAAESATRAIKRCQPYKLPIAKYEVWRDVEVTFDPRDMYRG